MIDQLLKPFFEQKVPSHYFVDYLLTFSVFITVNYYELHIIILRVLVIRQKILKDFTSASHYYSNR